MTPGKGYRGSRLRDEEQRGERTLRTKDARSRPANGFNLRRGKHRGITVDVITRAAFGTVNICHWNGTGYVASLNNADPQVQITVEAICFLLQDGVEIAADTAVWVEFTDDNIFEVTGAACAVRDWTLEGEE